MHIPTHRRITVCMTVVTLLVFFTASPIATASKPAIGPNGQGTVLVVGDSLTFGANYFGKLGVKAQSTNIWTKVVLDARNGRKATVGAKIISDKLTNTTTAVVVALGTNDMISKSETWYPAFAIDSVMEQVGDIPVLWVNLEFSPTGRADWRARGVRFNRALKAAALRYPNLVVADWNTFFTPKGQSRFVADGIHLSVTGYKTRTTYLINQMKLFGQRIVDATTTTTTSSTTTTTSTIPNSSSSTTTSSTTTSPSTSAPTSSSSSTPTTSSP
jgi:lysophospholipase L1-like esterase